MSTEHKLRVGQIVTIHPKLKDLHNIPYGINSQMIALAGARYKIRNLESDRVILDAPEEVTIWTWPQNAFLEYYDPAVGDSDFIIESGPALLPIKTK